MPWPVGEQVPVTSGVSGIVFVAAVFSVASFTAEAVVFAAWGAVYAIECAIRRPQRRPGRPQRPQRRQTATGSDATAATPGAG